MIHNNFEESIQHNKNGIIFWKFVLCIIMLGIIKFSIIPTKEYNSIILISLISFIPITLLIIHRNNKRITHLNNLIYINDEAKYIIELNRNWFERVRNFHNRIKDNKEYKVEIREKLIAIFPNETGLIKYWEPHSFDRGKIIGYWAEDGSPYEIIVPYQLRDMIIEMQHNLPHLFKHDKHKE